MLDLIQPLINVAELQRHVMLQVSGRIRRHYASAASSKDDR